jgi:PTH1 family peptidyl-tRNA hydrolase
MPDSPDIPGPGIRLVAGLGNPGREYEGTRHNIGFAVLDRVASLLGTAFAKEPKWHALMARDASSSLVLIKPTTFMNLSGDAVGEYARFHRIGHGETLVVLDDASLPLGALRLRREGGSGGQKGLESILMHFTTESVPRLRVGIGAATGPGDLSSHVLSRFSEAEQSAAGEAVLRAADAVLCALREGVDRAMNLYNATPPSVKPEGSKETTP